MKLNTLIINVLLATLCIVGIIAVATNFAIENSANTTLLRDPRINSTYSNLYQKLNETAIDTNESKTSFLEDLSEKNPIFAVAYFMLSSIFSIITTIINTTIFLFNLILLLPQRVFDVPPIVSGILMSIVTITIIFAGWRALKIGD